MLIRLGQCDGKRGGLNGRQPRGTKGDISSDILCWCLLNNPKKEGKMDELLHALVAALLVEILLTVLRGYAGKRGN